MEDKRQKALELLRSQTDSSLLSKEGYTSPLDQDIMKVKSTEKAVINDPIKKIATGTQKIDTRTPMKTISGGDFADKIARLRGLKNIAGKLPMVGSIVGGLGAMLGSEDASAAVPILNEAETTGPQLGSFDDRLEKGQLTPEELQELKKQMSGL